MPDITITEGDTLEVDYTLENTGDGTGTFNPRLLVQGVQEDQDTGITLDPAQTATGTLSWPTESGDAVTDALAEAVTDDTSDSITVTVETVAIPDSGGTHQWNFSDSPDLTVDDSIGMLNAPFTDLTWESGFGVDGTYASLDGVDDAADLGSASRTEFNHWTDSGQGTIAMWVRKDDTDSSLDCFFVSANSGNNNSVAFQDEGDGNLMLRIGGTGNIQDAQSGTGALTSGTWIFVAGTADGSNSYVYYATVNDSSISQVGSTSLTAPGGDLANNVGLGFDQKEGSRYFAGDMSLSYVNSTADTQSELDSWFNDTKEFFQ